MTTAQNKLSLSPVVDNLKHIPFYLLQPLRLIKNYKLQNLRPDLVAGLTLAVIVLPQAIAFALIAELPPEMGLYTAIVGAIVGGLWGASNQIHTGPTNAISLLVLSVLLTVAQPNTPEFIMAAGLMAVMAGIFQLAMGLARLGLLVNFVSHSVVVGFSSGAGVLIAVNQLRHLLGLDFGSHNLVETVEGIATHILQLHPQTTLLGFITIVLILAFQRFTPKIPAPPISMVIVSMLVFLFHLEEQGVSVMGKLPASLPPLASFLDSLTLDFIADLSAGALAIGAIGLVQTSAISRSISAQTGQRVSSNQEFVGQGLANIMVGLFSGYPSSGSFSLSAVNFSSGAKSPLSAIFSSIFVFIAMFALGSLTAYLPRTALAGTLILTAYRMVDKAEIQRIWRGAREDAWIMAITFLGTLFLEIEFAVLMGILFSFGVYILKTSVPRVVSVAPDYQFKHFVPQTETHAPCPQLGIIEILGDLYFGAVSHVERAILSHMEANPDQRFLLLRMHRVNQCDFSGIHALEGVVKSYREAGGDVFFVRISKPVLALMQTTGFYEQVGEEHFLSEDDAISLIFHKIIDPAICIYECEVRAFKECQNLPKQTQALYIPLYDTITPNGANRIKPKALWHLLGEENPPLIVDVREPREYKQGHVPSAHLIPLRQLLISKPDFNGATSIILVCQSGRRSLRAAYLLHSQGQVNVQILAGGMRAWHAAGLLEAVEV